MTDDPTHDGPAPGDGLAWPRDMEARYGTGLGAALVLGGGGLWFVAWQVAYLHELALREVHVTGADRVVGTSAGSIVASVLEAGNLGRLHTELRLLAKAPKVLAALAPAGDLQVSQMRALDLFSEATDAHPETIRAIGHAALAAATPGPSVMPRNMAAVLASRRWPSRALHITVADAYTGERCVITRSAGVGIARAVAASGAVPGLFAPQPIGDRRCMDGGVSGTGLHLDLVAGARRAVVLSLRDGADDTEGRMTSAPGTVEEEAAALVASGTEMLVCSPEAVDLDALMDPAAVPDALAMGQRQAATDVDRVRSFLG